MKLRLLSPLLAVSLITSMSLGAAPVRGWLSWRGPEQAGVSHETGLPERVDADAPLWTAPLSGQSTPVIADGRLYINGYAGDGQDLQEVVACFDAETGRRIWEHRENDFLSDLIYKRYSTSAPTVDPETGNVYVQGSQGMLMGFAADGRLLWRISMMEDFGRMTFPNGRTASPVVDGELVITRGITSSWGAYGPPGDRFYAFDKVTGELVWQSSPAGPPQDPSFSHPYLDWWGGRRVLYTAGGDSSVLAMDVRTGQPLWRFPFAKAGAKGGINASIVRHGDHLIALHESENLDSSEIGRMAAFRIPAPDAVKPPNEATPQVFTAGDLEVWRNGVGCLSSSPVVVGDLVYEVSGTGDLACVDAVTGKVLWKKKLGIEQRQSSPFHAGGLLYVAMYISAEGAEAAADASGGDGELFVLRPSRDGVEVVSQTRLNGRCYGSPVGYNGKLYVQTDKQLYCFGKPGANPGLAAQERAAAAAVKPWPAPGSAASLQAIPFEVILRPGQTQSYRIRLVDARGFVVPGTVDPREVKWERYIPPTALVRSELNGDFDASGRLVAAAAPEPSAGVFKGTWKGPDGRELTGFVKARILPGLPMKIDFEGAELSNTTTNSVEPATAFAYPPLPWAACRFKFEVREKEMDGKSNRALVKTIDNKRLQRGQVFVGHADMRNYTIEADVLTEGNRRKMSEVGLINQRYLIVLKGNSQQLEINSNQERIKKAVPFRWAPNEWYRLKARVDVAADGSGVVRAKAWKRGEPEPEAWNIEVSHAAAHAAGSPGFFGFSPQDQRLAIDNLVVTAN